MEISEVNIVPAPLRRKKQWVAWIPVPSQNGKPKKVSIDPKTGRAASVNNRETWASFKTAIRATSKFVLPGIGFVFTATDHFMGVDLDDCRDPKTGKLKKWARKIIKQLNSYTEISPSETGVKIFVIGEIPRSLKTKRVEMYAQKRFFTVTGQHIPGTQHEITEPDPVIIELIFEKYKRLKELRLSKDKTRKKHPSTHDHSTGNFSTLFDGDWSDFQSRSEADLALCHRLARLTKCNATRMDSLFRQSGLYRGKWDRPYSDGTTYGQRTINKAIARVKSAGRLRRR